MSDEAASVNQRRTFTLQEVAAMLGLSSRTIRRLVDARKFPAPLPECGRFRFLRSEVERWLEDGSVGARGRRK